MNNRQVKSDVSFLGVIQIAFIIFKLVGGISWSWWVVLFPLWITTGLVLIFVACTIADDLLK